jgi:CHAT domain-containing protein
MITCHVPAIIRICWLLTGIFMVLPAARAVRNETDPFHDPRVDQYLWNAAYEPALKTNGLNLDLAGPNAETSALLLLKQCDIYLAMGHHNDALVMLKKAVDQRDRLLISNAYIDFLVALEKGIILNQQNKFADAKQWLNMAMKLLKDAAPDPIDEARLFYELSNNASYTLDEKNAMLLCQQAIARLKGKSPFLKTTEAIYYSRLAYLCHLAGQPEMAAQASQHCNSLMKAARIEDHPAMLQVYLNLTAVSFITMDRWDTTGMFLNRALQLLQKHYPAGYYKYGLFYYYMGLFEQYRSDPEKSLAYYYQAEKYFSAFVTYNRLLQDIYFNKAEIFSTLRKNDAAAILLYGKYLNAGITDHSKRALVHIALGNCYKRLENFPKAIEYFKIAIKETADFDNHNKVVYFIHANLSLAEIYEKQHRKESVLQCLQTALETAKRHKVYKTSLAGIYRNLGAYYVLHGNPSDALGFYQAALGLCSKEFKDTSLFSNPVSPDSYMERRMIITLSMKAYAFYQLYATQGKDIRYLREALQCHEVCITALIKILMEIESENSEFSWDNLIQTSCNNAVSYACMLYNLTGDKGYADKALMFAEKSRMLTILLNNQHNSIGKIAGIPDALVKKEKALRSEIQYLQNRLLEAENKGIPNHVRQALVDKLTQLQLQGDSLIALYASEYKNYFDLKYNLKVLNIREIQERLHDDQVIIEYQLLRSELITLVISKNKVSLTLTPNDGTEITQIMQLRDAIAENPLQKDAQVVYSDFTTAASYLFNRLLQPFFDDLKGKKLIVIPHNELNLVPFDLLLTRSPAGNNIPDYAGLPYLIREVPVSYAYSCTILYDEVPDRKEGKHTGIYLPDYSPAAAGAGAYPDLPPLDGAREEVRAINKLLHGKVYRSRHATEKNFRSDAPRYQLLHLAAHTLMDEKAPVLSAFVMSPPVDADDDGLLHSYELYQMNLRARLVVLSSCNTGHGRLQYGEGLLSLARSFFFTGVRSVAYTQWQAADETSATIVCNFYKEIADGQPFEVALRSAKLEYIAAADPVKSHPYFWAGYVVTGNTDPIKFSHRSPWLVALLLVVIAGATGYWAYRRFNS